MRQMKDSGIEWIGEIPQNWKVRKIKYIFVQRNENNLPIKTTDILSLTAKQGVIPLSEKQGGGNKPKDDLTAYKLAYPGDIVINSMNILSGSVGISKYFGCVSPVYYMLRPINLNDDNRFYNYYFRTNEFQKSLLGLGNGIMMKESENGKLNTIRMRIPMDKLGMQFAPITDDNTQREISDYLDNKCTEIDNAIAKTTASIEEYKKLKQSIITKAVTKGIRGNRPMKDSGIEWIGEIPSDWEICKVRHIGTLQNGISKGGEFFGSGFPFVSYGDVYRNISLPACVDGLVQSSSEEQKLYSVQEGDIFFTRTSETIEEVGFSSVCENDIPKATFAGFLIRLRPNKNKIYSGFSKYYFRSSHHRSFLVKEMNLVTRASLGQSLLKSMFVLLPGMNEQYEIAEYLDSKCNEIDNIISRKQQLITELEAYKKSLIYEYVTGKKEVV